MGVFDPAVFDSAVFDTQAVTPVAPGIVTGGPWPSSLNIVGEPRSSLTINGGPWASGITIAG